MILAFPYMYFSLDAGFRAIDVHTLTEASQNLGASWRTTLLRVILPNIRVAAIGGRLPDARDRDGRVHDRAHSRHSTPSRSTLQYINQNKAYPAAAVSLMSFGITWVAMLALLLVGRGTARSQWEERS